MKVILKNSQLMTSRCAQTTTEGANSTLVSFTVRLISYSLHDVPQQSPGLSFMPAQIVKDATGRTPSMQNGVSRLWSLSIKHWSRTELQCLRSDEPQHASCCLQ